MTSKSEICNDIYGHDNISNSTSATMDSTSTPSASFLSLPPEMQLRIFSFLPAKDVQRCRRVNREIRDVVDLKENHILSLKPGIVRSMHRFETAIDRYCNHTFPGVKGSPRLTVSFHNALVDYATLKTETTSDPTQVWHQMYHFAVHWLLRRRFSLPPGQAQENDPDLDTFRANNEQFYRFVYDLYEAHEYWASHAKPPHYHVDTERLERLLIRTENSIARAPSVGFLTGLKTGKEVADLFLGIEKQGNNGFGLAPRHGRRATFYPITRECDVVDLMVPENVIAWRRDRYLISKDMTAKFGVPLLEETAPVSWVCTSRWAVDEIQAVLTGEKTLDSVKKAAVLEELCLA